MHVADRSLRSVFVGNIPYDATEEKLRDIFSAVGPVLSFRIVFDRETGKPKGYGFCEYKDQETATSAIRNLNGHDLGGRQLRVDSASNERARDEPDAPAGGASTGGGGVSGAGGGAVNVGGGIVNVGSESQLPQHQLQHSMQHQQPLVSEPLVDAQTLVHNVIKSTQPEQLFDICKQLKASLLVNPNETRQLLMQNPQLSYALLQSLEKIEAIDDQTARNTLHKQLVQPAPMQPTMLMMAPMGPALSGTGLTGPQAPGANPMVMQPQPITSAAPLVMQPQVMNPFAFMPNTMVATSTAQPPQQAPIQPVSMPVTPAAPSAAPADPRLARQHHQQQQQQQQQQQHPPQPQQPPQQQQQQQTQLGMSEQERQAFILQLVNMTEQEISLLPPDQQDKVYMLRRQYVPSGQ